MGVFWNAQGEPSTSLFSFVHDYNADGWPVVLAQGRAHLHAPYWYENPKGAAGHWKKHLVFERIRGENPQMVDTGSDGKPELLCNWGGMVGLLRPDADPYKNWSFTVISEAGPWFSFTHGIGAGDLNGDGRSDFIQPDFWWAQSPQGTAGTWAATLTEFRDPDPKNGDGGAQMFAYDVDGDRATDVLSASKLGAFLFLNQTPPVSVLRFPQAHLRFPQAHLRFPQAHLRFPQAHLRFPQAGTGAGRRRALYYGVIPSGTAAWSVLGRAWQGFTQGDPAVLGPREAQAQ